MHTRVKLLRVYSQIGDAGEDHTQIVGGYTVKLLGGIYPPLVSAPLLSKLDLPSSVTSQNFIFSKQCLRQGCLNPASLPVGGLEINKKRNFARNQINVPPVLFCHHLKFWKNYIEIRQSLHLIFRQFLHQISLETVI